MGSLAGYAVHSPLAEVAKTLSASSARSRKSKPAQAAARCPVLSVVLCVYHRNAQSMRLSRRTIGTLMWMFSTLWKTASVIVSLRSHRLCIPDLAEPGGSQWQTYRFSARCPMPSSYSSGFGGRSTIHGPEVLRTLPVVVWTSVRTLCFFADMKLFLPIDLSARNPYGITFDFQVT